MHTKLLLTASIALALAGNCFAAVKDGSYTTTVTGHNAPLTVTVDIKNGKISDISVKDLESPGVGKVAIKQLSAEIKDHQTTKLDKISGATITSFSLLGAVKQCLKQAGAQGDEFNKPLPAADKSPIKDNADVVIVGGGGAGLASAVSALQNGASVIIVEKLGFLGGSTNVCGGALNASGTKYQKALGIEDNPQKHFEQTMKGGHNVSDPKLVKVLADNAPSALLWLESMGLKFRPDVMQVYGALWPRSHLATEPKGTGFIRVLSTKAKELGVDIMTNTKLVKIIREQFDEGRALGVMAERQGKPFYIRATKGIVLAAGGFAANPRLRAIHDPRMLTLTTTNNQACSTGEVMLAANEAGAYLMGLDYIQCNPGCPPGHTSRQALHLDVSRYVFVDKRGKRFVAEDARRDVLRDAILNLPEKFGYAIVDNDGFNSYNQVVRDDAMKGLKTGDAFKADTLEGLAKQMGVPADQLKKTIADYNAMVDQKKDPDFGKAERNLSHKIEKAPYWAALSSMAVHHTMGGVRIDKETRVLDRQGNVIKGLYAAGEVTGGIHGTNRLGGNAIADIFTFGRIAGNSAANQK